MTTQSNPNVLFFCCCTYCKYTVAYKNHFISMYLKGGGGGGGETLTPENYKSLLATRISVRVETTSSS